MTETERSLLDAVLENPDDDLPRLVYADWLDENGDPKRAEFIRAQIVLCREFDHQKFDSQEYISATKQVMNVDASDYYQWIYHTPPLAITSNQITVDVYEEVVRIRDTTNNVHFHFDRGFVFAITSTIDWINKNSQIADRHPLKKFRFNLSTNTWTTLYFESNSVSWTGRIIQGKQRLSEKKWQNRWHCFDEVWGWSNQVLQQISRESYPRAVQ